MTDRETHREIGRERKREGGEREETEIHPETETDEERVRDRETESVDVRYVGFLLTANSALWFLHLS